MTAAHQAPAPIPAITVVEAIPSRVGIVAIDPGTTQSAWVRWDGAHVLGMGLQPNEEVLDMLGPRDTAVIEGIESFGMPVGRDTFETVFWSGRFAETSGQFHRVYRKAIKLHLCGSTKAKDSNIRQALLDRFGPGREVAVGRKASPGPLYGIKSHIWQALAVAVTYTDTLLQEAH